MRQQEQKIKKEIRRKLTSNGIYWDNVKQGKYSKPGQPDLIICYKGRFIQVEAKTFTGEQKKLQKTRESEIKKQGGIYWVIRSWDELDNNLKEIAE